MTQQPTTKTIKCLFAASGNRCAFPGCDRPLVTGEICHIRARSPGGIGKTALAAKALWTLVRPPAKKFTERS